MSLPPADIDWSAGPLEPKGLKIGLYLDAGSGLPVDPEVKAAIEAAARLFAAAGAKVEPMEGFLSPEMLHLQDLFWRVRSWVDFSALSHAKQASVLPFIADWCRGGADVSGATVIKGVNNYMAIRAAAVKATQPFDYVLSPVSPVPTYPAEWETPTNDVKRPLEHISFTMPYNMSEQPAASINCGYTKEGKPIGLQIAGRRFDDLGVMRLSRWFEHGREGRPQKKWPEPPKSRTAMKPLGILMLDTRFPRIEGDIGNPASFDFPVILRTMKGIGPDDAVAAHPDRPRVLAALADNARKLAEAGAVGISTSCGFLALYQKELAKRLAGAGRDLGAAADRHARRAGRSA